MTPSQKPQDGGAAEWRTDFENIPTDGTVVEFRRDDCPGYETTGSVIEGKLHLASWFIRGDMRILTRPTHWRQVQIRRSSHD